MNSKKGIKKIGFIVVAVAIAMFIAFGVVISTAKDGAEMVSALVQGTSRNSIAQAVAASDSDVGDYLTKDELSDAIDTSVAGGATKISTDGGSTIGEAGKTTVYKVTKNLSITATAGAYGERKSGLKIAEGATVKIYIEKGVTLSCTGANAYQEYGAGAGIEVPSTSSLYFYGEGQVIATGGKAANGANGEDSGLTVNSASYSGDSFSVTRKKPGNGGRGGGGAGAGIGGRGGNGGYGGHNSPDGYDGDETFTLDDDGDTFTRSAAYNVERTYGVDHNNNDVDILFLYYKLGNKTENSFTSDYITVSGKVIYPESFFGEAGEDGEVGTDCGKIYAFGAVSIRAFGGEQGEGGIGGSAGGTIGYWFNNKEIVYDKIAIGANGSGGGGGGGGSAHGIGGGGGGGGGGGAGTYGYIFQTKDDRQWSMLGYGLCGRGGTGGSRSASTSGVNGYYENGTIKVTDKDSDCASKVMDILSSVTGPQISGYVSSTKIMGPQPGDYATDSQDGAGYGQVHSVNPHRWLAVRYIGLKKTKVTYKDDRFDFSLEYDRPNHGGYYMGRGRVGNVYNYTNNNSAFVQNVQGASVQRVSYNIMLDPITYARDNLKASTTDQLTANNLVLYGVTPFNTLTFAQPTSTYTATGKNNLSDITSAIGAAGNNQNTTNFYAKYMTSWEEKVYETDANGNIVTDADGNKVVKETIIHYNQFNTTNLSVSVGTGLSGYSAPNLPGYKFTGYYLGLEEDSIRVINEDLSINKNYYVVLSDMVASFIEDSLNVEAYRLYAHYEPITYTVHLNSNGGSVNGEDTATLPDQVYTFDQGYVVPTNVITDKTTNTTYTLAFNTYIFDGWDESNFISYSKATGYSVDYTMDSTGLGATVTRMAATVSSDSNKVYPQDAMVSNYNFVLRRAVLYSGTHYTSEITIYAAWKKQLVVDVEDYSATSPFTEGIGVYYNSAVPNIESMLTTTPMLNFRGYANISFAGVYTQKNGSGVYLWNNKGAEQQETWSNVWSLGGTNNNTLYLKWIVTATTDGNKRNGNTPSKPSTDPATFTAKTITFTLGQTYSKSASEVFPLPTRTGYTLRGWTFDSSYEDASTAELFLDANGNNIAGTTSSQQWVIDYSGCATLYAVWTPTKYLVDLMQNATITFTSADGNSVTENLANDGLSYVWQTVEVSFDSQYPNLDITPTLAGFTFQGFTSAKTSTVYYINANGNATASMYLTSEMLDSNGNAKPLYAQWKEKKYTLSVAIRGNDDSAGNPTYVTTPVVSVVRRDSYRDPETKELLPKSGWVTYGLSSTGTSYAGSVPRGKYILLVEGSPYLDSYTDLAITDSDYSVKLSDGEQSTPYIFRSLDLRVTGDNTILFKITLRSDNSNSDYIINRTTSSSNTYWIFAGEKITVKATATGSTTESFKGVNWSYGHGLLNSQLVSDDDMYTQICSSGAEFALQDSSVCMQLVCSASVGEFSLSLATPKGNNLISSYGITYLSSTVVTATDPVPNGMQWKDTDGNAISGSFDYGQVYTLRFAVKASDTNYFVVDRTVLKVNIIHDNVTYTYVNQSLEGTTTDATGYFKFYEKATSGFSYEYLELEFTFPITAAQANAWVDNRVEVTGGAYSWTGSPVTTTAVANQGDVIALFASKSEYESKQIAPQEDKNHTVWKTERPTAVGTYYAYFYVVGTDAYTSLSSELKEFTIIKYNINIGEHDGGSVKYNGKEQTSTLSSARYGSFDSGKEPTDSFVLTITNVNETNAGVYKITIALNDVDNYMLNGDDSKTLVTTYYTIEKVALTVGLLDVSILYGDTLDNATLSENYVYVDGLVSGETWQTAFGVSQFEFATDYDPSSYDTRKAGGTYTLIVTNAKAENYNVTYVGTKLTVNKKQLIINPKSVTVTYGESFTIDFDISGVGEDGIICFDETKASVFGDMDVVYILNYNANNPKCNTYTMGLQSGIDNNLANYTVILGTEGKLVITQRTFVIKAGDVTVTYGDSLYNSQFSYTVRAAEGYEEALVNGDTFETLTQKGSTNKVINMISYSCIYNINNVADRVVGKYDIVVSGATETDNYKITYEKGKLTVTKAQLYVTVNATSILYGTATPTSFAYTATGFMYGEGTSVIDESNVVFETLYDSTNKGSRSIGSYVVSMKDLSATNYDFTYYTGNLTVTALPLTLSVSEVPTMTYGDNKVDIKWVFSGNTVPYVDDAYDEETELKKWITYIWDGSSVALSTLNAGSHPVNAVSVSTVDNSGNATIAANYTISYYLSLNVVVNKRESTISVGTIDSIVYGTATLPIFSVTADDNMLDRDFATLSSALSNYNSNAYLTDYNVNLADYRKAGTYYVKINQTEIPTSITNNYVITCVDGSFTVTKKPINVTVEDISILYGQAFDPNSVTIKLYNNNDLEYGDDVSAFASTIDVTPKKYDSDGNYLYDYNLSSASTRSGGTYSLVLSVNAANTNYELKLVSAVLNVQKRKVKVSVESQTINYGEEFDSTDMDFSFSKVASEVNSGLAFDDDADWLKSYVKIVVPYDILVYENRKVGAYPFTASEISNSSYTIDTSEVSGNLYVQAVALSVTVKTQSLTYGDEVPTFTFIFAGAYDDDLIALQKGFKASTAYRILNGGVYTNKDVGTYEVSITDLTASDTSLKDTCRTSNYVVTTKEGSLKVEKKLLTITLNSTRKEYGSENLQQSDYPGYMAVGFAYTSDEALVVSLTYFTGRTTIGANGNEIVENGYDVTHLATRSVGKYVINAKLAETLDNYEVSIVPGSLEIYKAPLSIVVESKTITYGQGVSFTVKQSGIISRDADLINTISIICDYDTTVAGKHDATTYAIGLNYDENAFANYTVTVSNGTLTVNKAVLTITANSQSLIYGDEMSTPTAVYSGFVLGENVAVLEGKLGFTTKYDTSDTTGVNRGVGLYTITPIGYGEGINGEIENGNYLITYVAGTITVSRKVLTVTAGNVSAIYGTSLEDIRREYALTGISGFAYGEGQDALIGTVSYSTTYNPNLATTRKVGTYSITASGLSSNNYNITWEDGKLEISKSKLTITSQDVELTYGTTPKYSVIYDPTFNYTKTPTYSVAYEGFAWDDTYKNLTGTLVYDTDYVAGSSVGTYDIMPKGYNSANYEITYKGSKLTVTKAVLSITTSAYTISYGERLPVYEAIYTGFVLGEDESVLDGEILIRSDYRQGNDVGTYSVTISGVTAENYDITFVGTRLRVSAIKVTAPTVASMAYTGEKQVPTIATSPYYTIVSNGGGTSIGTYSVTLTVNNYPNYVWASGASGETLTIYYNITSIYYTVTFEQTGGVNVKGDETLSIASGDAINSSKAPSYLRDGYTFAGWFTDADHTEIYNLSSPVEEDMTLYGYWIKEENTLAGRVVDSKGVGIANATISVVKGGNVWATLTSNEEGYFSEGGAEKGLYNLVVTYSAESGDRTIVYTENVTCGYDEMLQLTVENEKINTKIEITSTDIAFVVDDLNKALTADDLSNVGVGGAVELVLKVAENEKNKVNVFSNDAGLNRKDVSKYFTVSATKQTTSVVAGSNPSSQEVKSISGTIKILINIDGDIAGKTGYVLYRSNGDGTFTTLTETANASGEYVKVSEDGKYLEAYLSTFGEFAIGYDTANLSTTNLIIIAVAVGAGLVCAIVVWAIFFKKRKKIAG